MSTVHRFSAGQAVALLCVVLLVGAGGCREVSGPCPLATLTVTPDPLRIVVNTTGQFTATGRDYQGNVLDTVATWSIVDGGGTINAGSGLFTAGAVTGTFANTVQAISNGISATATVIVIATPGALATITVTPNPATVIVNGTQQFTATGRDADNNIVAITPTWSIVADGGAINAGSGLFTAGAVTGAFPNTVRAASGGISGYATVNVTSPVPAATLGSAATFAILGGSTVTNTGATTTIVGDVGVSPGTAITGLPAGQPTGGSIHAGDATAATAQTDLTTAYNDLAGRACGTNLTSEDLGGMTLAPGVYCFNSSAALTGTLTLDGQGDANAVFVIQIASTLTTASGAAVDLIGSAQAQNVFWQVGSSATLGTGTAFAGNIVALQSVTLATGASLSGRALARNGAVTLDTNAVNVP
ncbi:MAG: ice-binding family protein [Candidatus Krumholzibacteriia bacterium]